MSGREGERRKRDALPGYSELLLHSSIGFLTSLSLSKAAY